MPRLLKYFFIALTVVASACSRDHHGSENVASPAFENATDTAERLVDEGEKVFSFQSMNESQDKFHAALSADPANPRARFWVATTDLLYQFRGVLTRAQPYLETDADIAARYKWLRQQSTASSNSNPALRFLTDGPADVNTSDEFMDWVDQIRNAVANARTTMHEIRDSDISITVPKMLSANSNRNDCKMLAFGPIKFQIAEMFCNAEGPNTFGLNAGDFDQISQILTFFQLNLDILTAYRFNPRQLIINLNHPMNTRQDAENFVENLFTGTDNHNVAFDGSLRRPMPFFDLHAIGAQMLIALKYQQQNQATLCPMGYSSPNNRRGYLFSAGSCIPVNESSSDRKRSVQLLEAMVGGRNVESEDGYTEINYSELADHPPDNLKDVLQPLKFNACGKISEFNTAAFPKIFQRIDYSKVFRSRCKLENTIEAR